MSWLIPTCANPQHLRHAVDKARPFSAPCSWSPLSLTHKVRESLCCGEERERQEEQREDLRIPDIHSSSIGTLTDNVPVRTARSDHQPARSGS
jgi:hypothetical protein